MRVSYLLQNLKPEMQIPSLPHTHNKKMEEARGGKKEEEQKEEAARGKK